MAESRLAAARRREERITRRPSVLYVTSDWPLAPAYGAQLRSLHIARLLGRVCDLSLAIVDSGHADEETVRRTRSEFDVRGVFSRRRVVHRTAVERVRHRLRHDLDPRYLLTTGWTATDSDQRALELLMEQHDVVWIHQMLTAAVFRIDRWPHSVLDVDDLQSRFYRSWASTREDALRRLLDLRMSLVWRRRERLFTRRFDVVTVCSEQDRTRLGRRPRIHVIPNGFSPHPDRPRPPANPARIGFIGTFNYPPNEQGVKWFVQQAWPLVRRLCPLAQLRLVGRDSERLAAGLGDDVVGLGWVEDPAEEIASWSAMIVPVHFGGGTRVKIAEAFARRCPVVSTPVGAFGYDVRDGEEILIAEGADAFAAACVRLMTDRQLGEALAEKAHAHFLQQWTWDSFESRVGAAVEECLARGDR